jgi:hypothetical protein
VASPVRVHEKGAATACLWPTERRQVPFEAGGRSTDEYRSTDPASQFVIDEAMSSGVVIEGRRTADFAGYWGGDRHGAPCR